MISPNSRSVFRFVLPLLVAAAATGRTPAASPPALVNYQGVLRDQNDKPLSGSYDMLFRFLDAATGGNEILKDQHAASSANAVTVSGGLFSVALGSGTVADGSGPGSYTTLDAVFRDYGSVWLEVKVGAETLAPRTQVQSAAYALSSTNAVSAVTATNASQLNGLPSSYFLDASPTYQVKPGPVQFLNSDPSVAAMAAVCASSTSTGVSSTGCSDTGGYFATSGTSSTAVLGFGGAYGVRGYGTVGGLFVDPGWANYGYIGDQPDGAGVVAVGTNRGLYFSSSSENYGDVGYFDGFRYYGIWAHGYHDGGYFENASSGTYAFVGDSQGASIRGNGAKNFIQNHPERDDRTIAYAALEGDEVGTYTRGSGRLVRGEARVTLGETFQWVTNPELGLTVYVAPVGAPARLYVAEKSTTAILVKGAPGDPDVDFDYIVLGLRIGFENANVVREKEGPAPIPAMTGLEEQQARHPELRASTARARFEGMERATGRTVRSSYTKASALLEKIKATDHGVTESPGARAARLPEVELRARMQALASGTSGIAPLDASNPAVPRPVAAVAPPAARVDAGPSAREMETPPPAMPAVLAFETSEAVGAGDLLALDPSAPGKLRRTVSAMDPNVVGVAAEPSRTVDGAMIVGVAAVLFTSVNVDAGFGAIHPGDPLVSSPAPGQAMAAKSPLPGTVFGKALEGLDSGTGLIRVLLGAR
jgi:hypothetical protein